MEETPPSAPQTSAMPPAAQPVVAEQQSLAAPQPPSSNHAEPNPTKADTESVERRPNGDGKRTSFPGEEDKEHEEKEGSKSKKKGSNKSMKSISDTEEEEEETRKKTPKKSSLKSKKKATTDDEGSGRDDKKKKSSKKSQQKLGDEDSDGESGRDRSPVREMGSAKKKSVKSPLKSRRERDDEYTEDFDDYESDESHQRRHDDRDSRYKPDRQGGRDNDCEDDYSQYSDDISSELSRARYEGDLSSWGRKRDPEFYNDRRGHGDGGYSESDYTMSSGLSPRDSVIHKPFDVQEAKHTLAYNAGLFGRAQALRRGGKAPKTLGIADDLPDRFAFQQLQQLAGMARKVQDAIQHNKRVFEQRVLSEDMQIKKKVFHAWRAARYGTLAKQQLLARVLARMMRSRLSKAFFAWKDRFGQVDKNFAMRRKLQATINKGRMRRAFLGWRKILTDRWWKTQLETRDSRIHALEKKITGFEMRPIMVIRRRRLDAMLTAWFNMSEDRRRRRMRFEKAGRHYMNRQLSAAWNTWYALHMEKQREGMLLKKAAGRMKNLGLSRGFYKWYDLILEKRQHEKKLGKALRHWKNQSIAKAWDTWWQHVLWRREKKKIISRWMQPMKARAFYTWIDQVQWRKRMRVVMDRSARRLRNAGIAKAFDAWRSTVEGSKVDFHLTKKEELAVQVKALSEENERLRRDNERFVRLIDSGEWGRGRVAELVSAGEVLKGERDALMKLIQSMRHEYEAVQGAKGAQEDELRRLKERMLLGGAARNKMLVKGASSYNALKRAIKQDLVDAGGAPAQDPNLLYEIDKLSLERVSVFPDGDINIEAISTAGSAAFSKPVSSAQALRSTVAPAYPMHVPQGLPGGSRGSPANAARPSARTLEILNRLQGLTPAELDRVEERLRAEAVAKSAHSADLRGPAGMSSSARR